MKTLKFEAKNCEPLEVDNSQEDVIIIMAKRPFSNQSVLIPRALIPAFAAFFESQKDLTKEQAKSALTQGAYIKHQYFTDSEYLYFEQGVLKDEKGYYLDWKDFWGHKDNECFDRGWYIVSREEVTNG
ncbi:MAG: hypothetical protein L6Q66_12940 [Bacteroidia bacterium]|nr:hypothetical protein [Bacteroidia bacterium]